MESYDDNRSTARVITMKESDLLRIRTPQNNKNIMMEKKFIAMEEMDDFIVATVVTKMRSRKHRKNTDK